VREGETHMASDTIRAAYTQQTVYLDTPEMLARPEGTLRVIAERHGISLGRVIRYCIRHGLAAAQAIEHGRWPAE